MKGNLKLLALIAGPFAALCSWLALGEAGLDEAAIRVISAGLWMVVWWGGEAGPTGVTSVLPAILVRLFGV